MSALCVVMVLSFLAVQLAFVDPLRRHPAGDFSKSILIEPFGPLYHPTFAVPTAADTTEDSSEALRQPTLPPAKHSRSRRVLVLAAAPRSPKHIVALWSSLECFTSDADHVAISAPNWSQPILEEFLAEAIRGIPRFASGETTLEAMVGVNDRYDVGLWCNALEAMGLDRRSGTHAVDEDPDSPYDEIALLNDSVYALREYTEIFRALGENKVSMTSLNYSFVHPKGTGDEFYWLESVWRGFDKTGIHTFVEHSCRPATDQFFCPNAWWGRKGCIVENFERAMAWQFPRAQTVGLFPSDVPHHMLTLGERFHNYRTWVRHPAYWNQLVDEQNFPVAKVNWKGMIDSLDDDRLQACTQHLDRSWLNQGFDFSVAQTAL